MGEHVNIAMWSGPRNISTAMMYSFGNRSDCFVWDEPFYGFALETAGRAIREEAPDHDFVINAFHRNKLKD